MQTRRVTIAEYAAAKLLAMALLVVLTVIGAATYATLARLSADTINAGIEVLWVFATWASIAQVRRDRCLRGISPWHVALVLGTAMWFLYFYAHLGQWHSFSVTVLYVCTMLVWVGHLLWYWARGVVDDEHTLMRHVVDVTWGNAYEDESVPSTKHADKLIAIARQRMREGT